MLRAEYLARNPDLPIDAAMAEISDHGQNAKVFPITDHPTFELLTESGEFTSACSLTPYTGGLFTGRYARSTFVAEPVHNLVHRDVLEPSGSTLRATRGSEGREFLASTDSWFRPVSLYIGPDGALYVIDYYRKRIEHPEWTASEFQKNPSEFSLGADRGRIYRIVPDGFQSTTSKPTLDKADTGATRCAVGEPEPVVATHGTATSRGRQARGRRAAADLAGAGPRTSGTWAGCTRSGRSMGWGISTTRSFSRLSMIRSRPCARMRCGWQTRASRKTRRSQRLSSIARARNRKAWFSFNCSRRSDSCTARTPRPRSPRCCSRTSMTSGCSGRRSRRDPNERRNTWHVQSRQARLRPPAIRRDAATSFLRRAW